MARSVSVLLAGACTLLLPSLSPAHHSVAFYSADAIELVGEITNVGWQNPHIQFGFRDAAGNSWKLGSSAIFLRERDGVTRDMFHVGDDVKVFGRISSHDAAALLVTNMLLPDGREAPLWPGSPPHFVSADKTTSSGTRTATRSAATTAIEAERTEARRSPREFLRAAPARDR
jgi:hypothetical protein